MDRWVMSRVLAGVLTITVVLGFVANGVWAYNFGGSSGIDNNGNEVDITVNGQNPWSQSYTVGPAEPGYTGYVNLSIRNIGGSSADLYLKLYNISDSDTVRRESEYKAEKLVGEKYDISKKIRVGVYNGLNYEDKGILKDVDGEPIGIGKVDIGDTVYIDLAFHLEDDTGNEYQGGQSEFDMSLLATISDTSDSSSSDGKENNRVGGSDDTDSGHGVVTPEHSDNIVLSETHDRNLMSGISIYYDFSSHENDIYQIRVTDNDDEKHMSIRTEILRDRSKTVNNAAPGNVYRNINVWSDTDNIREYDITFKVERGWSEKYSPPENVRLFRWNKDKWEELDTKIINKDNKYYYFESRASSYGAFAITGTMNSVGNNVGDMSIFRQMLNSIFFQIWNLGMKDIYYIIYEENYEN